MAIRAGFLFLFCGLTPFFAAMIVTGNFSVFTGTNLWIALVAAFVAGGIAAITAISSGLNSLGTSYVFISVFATSIYAVFVLTTLTVVGSIPYFIGDIITGFGVFCYAIGVFMIATDSGTNP